MLLDAEYGEGLLELITYFFLKSYRDKHGFAISLLVSYSEEELIFNCLHDLFNSGSSSN